MRQLSPLTLDHINVPAGFTPSTVSIGNFSLIPFGQWPDCLRCGQSMTGVYGGKANCNRCSSAMRLNG